MQTGGGQSGDSGVREEAAARVHVSMGLGSGRLRTTAPRCAEPSTEPGSGRHPWLAEGHCRVPLPLFFDVL